MSEPLASPFQGDLVGRIVAGERQAEEELVGHYGEGLQFLLRRWTRDTVTAEDLFQETVRLALEKIRGGEVREPGKLAGFLRSLAKNLAIHHYRRDAIRQERERDLDSAPLVAAGEPMEPLAHLLRAEKAALVRQAIAELPRERDRQVLFRFYIAEEDKERICADLGLGSQEFNIVLFRARQRYRNLLAERLGEPGG